MRTCGPITAYGPMTTVESSCALQSMIALAWMCVILCPVPPGERCTSVRLRGNCAFHFSAGAEFPGFAPRPFMMHVQNQCVARRNRPFEARLVNACEVIQRLLRDLFGAAKGQQRGGLCERFNDEHAWHQRALREVAAEIRLID